MNSNTCDLSRRAGIAFLQNFSNDRAHSVAGAGVIADFASPADSRVIWQGRRYEHEAEVLRLIARISQQPNVGSSRQRFDMATEDNDICRTQALRPTTDSQRAFSIEEVSSALRCRQNRILPRTWARPAACAQGRQAHHHQRGRCRGLVAASPSLSTTSFVHLRECS